MSLVEMRRIELLYVYAPMHTLSVFQGLSVSDQMVCPSDMDRVSPKMSPKYVCCIFRNIDNKCDIKIGFVVFSHIVSVIIKLSKPKGVQEMVAYYIGYQVRGKEKEYSVSIEARNLKSAKKKIGKKHGYKTGNMIQIHSVSVIGYF